MSFQLASTLPVPLQRWLETHSGYRPLYPGEPIQEGDQAIDLNGLTAGFVLWPPENDTAGSRATRLGKAGYVRKVS